MTGWLGELKLYGMVLVVVSIVCLTARVGGRADGEGYYSAADPELYRRAVLSSQRADRPVELAPPAPDGLLATADDDP